MGYDQTFLLSSHDSGETLSELGKEEHETLIAFIYLFIYLYIYFFTVIRVENCALVLWSFAVWK